jgi:Family of unknown function (DUF6141)
MSRGAPKVVLFQEEQRFRQPFFVILAVGLAGLSTYALIGQVALRRPFGQHPAPDAVLWIIWAAFGLAFPFFMLSLRMTTEVSDEGIVVRFPPFFRRLISLEKIRSFEVRKYSALKEYGGWGVRYSLKHGTAYNVSGPLGVQLTLQDGKKILIGSQSPDRLAGALGDLLRYRR